MARPQLPCLSTITVLKVSNQLTGPDPCPPADPGNLGGRSCTKMNMEK